MHVHFTEETSPDIDIFVNLANDRVGDHRFEWLSTPLRDGEWDRLINDTRSEDEVDPTTIRLPSPREFSLFGAPRPEHRTKAIVAVDAGVIDLGDLSSGGTVFAIRGAAVCYPGDGTLPSIYLYNTGAIAVDGDNLHPLFHYLGHRLGRENIFIDLGEDGRYASPKQAMLENPNQIQDRCRNFVERIIQEEAIAILSSYGGGVLLIDGALPAGTFDTPQSYLENLLRTCRNRGISVAAISKKTRISVGGRPIFTLFSDSPEFVGYAKLTEILEQERRDIAEDGRSVNALSLADDIFALRFGYGPTSLTFRADVHPTVGLISSDVLDQIYSRCPIYGGYPRPLIDAHQFSSFMYQDVQNLLADVVVRLGLRPQEKQTMEVLFMPFGGHFK